MGRTTRQRSTSFTFRFALLMGTTIQIFFLGLAHQSRYWSQEEPHALLDRVNTPQDELPLNTPQDELPLKTVLKEARDRELKLRRTTAERVNELKEARHRELKEALDWRPTAAGGRATAAKPAAAGAAWQRWRADAERINKRKEAQGTNELKEAQGKNEREDNAGAADAKPVARGAKAPNSVNKCAAAAKPAARGAKAPNSVNERAAAANPAARRAEARSSLHEGSPVKCHGHIRRSSVYRYTCGEIRQYPNQAVASSWDANWSTKVRRIDCSNIPKGPDMSQN